ncbi:uncharacterized protein PSANT_01725 [Moesziomyces antarcticus]|uniref:Uncharacterized protein n=1 Tax=Pseudozyma antarctica TaxID=84753 RepID=A0A5C3FIM9_PSEA2|nr:uncharacterized protein PSANT_01725 [Moesziomyces antarcticus]
MSGRTQASLDSAPADADIAICYHGHNSAYTNDGNTVKDADVFGGLRWADCNGIGIDCFWMSGGGKLGENIFQYWGDDGPDNLAFVKRNDNCEYHPDDKIIYCHN